MTGFAHMRFRVRRLARAFGAESSASAGAIVGLVAVLGLLAAGCGDDSSPARPPLATAMVEGRVGAALPGDDMSVEFTRLDVPGTTYTTRVDDVGRYRAELPVGDFRVALRGAAADRTFLAREGGVTTAVAEAETLRLREGDVPRRRDFGLGALRLVIGGLEALEGWNGRMSLHRVQADTVSIWSVGSRSVVVNDGALELRTLPAPPGSYRLLLHFDTTTSQWSYTETFWCASSAGGSVPDTPRIGPDSLTTHEPVLPRPAVLSGRITGAWRELGARPPSLEAIGTDGAFACRLDGLDDDGSFRLVLPRPRPVRVGIGEERHVWIGGVDEGTATVFAPSPGEVIDGIDEVVAGMLVRPIAEVPLSTDESYRVELHDPQGLVPVRSFSSVGGSWARAHSLRPGTYRVRLVGDPARSLWRPQWYERAATIDLAAPVVVPADGSVVVLDPVLERGGQISGTATGDGTANCYALITTADEAVVMAYAAVTSVATGFRWTGLADGRYRVGLYCGWEWPWMGMAVPAGTLWHPGVTEWAAAGDLEIVDAGVVTGLQLGPLPAR
ncbi:MAG: hypothetical protein IPK64_17790 [bacterium]|nr:hypothetical protein [bacterium]